MTNILNWILLIFFAHRFVTYTESDFVKQESCHDDDHLEVDKYSRSKNRPTIKTNFGDVQGKIKIFYGEEVMASHGIRYAKPPVGELRFAKPLPVDADTIKTFGLQHDDENVSCVQPKNFLFKDELIVSEDCLHLNIWVPLTKNGSTNDTSSKQLPVMVWIHGGSFHFGSGNQDEFNGIALASFGQVIVVTLNYRLGFFGFLNAGVDSAPGNMGLYDQAAALKWINENVEKFGGNPEEITVFGESAGALSVGLLTVSPLTKHLFRRAIIESGSPYSPVRPEPQAKVFEKSLLFSKAMNCSRQSDNSFTKSSMECLRNVDYKVIDDYGRNEVMHSQIMPNPMIGDELIPANVRVLMKNPENIDKDILIGMNRDEGFVFVYQQLRHLLDSYQETQDSSMKKAEVYSLVTKLLKARPVDPSKATEYYFKNMNEEWKLGEVLNSIIELYGDLYINCPVYYLAKRLTEIQGHERTHSYMLTKASSQAYMPVCEGWSKVCHGDELALIFAVPFRNQKLFDDSDRAHSKQLMQIWTDFVRSGKVPWRNDLNNWLAEIPLAVEPNFQSEKTYACEAFWRELFENQMESN